MAVVSDRPFTIEARADSVGELRGRITDATTATPVVAATVRIVGTRFGAQVDDNGR
jgi:hypothetical protein